MKAKIMKEKAIVATLWSLSFVSVAVLVVIVTYVFMKGFRMINLEFLTTSPYRFELGGIFPQIVGSLLLVGLCLAFSALLGVGAAVYLSEYAPNNSVTRITRFFIECLAGIPSIVIGLFGLAFLVHYLKMGISLISGSLSLSFMILPWTVRASEEAIKSVPFAYREASYALGATKLQTIRKVILGSAGPGIITGVVLGAGEAIGETAVVLLTAGSGLESFLPRAVTDPVASLTVYIYMIATQGHTSGAFDRAYGASLVLIAIFLLLSCAALYARNRLARKFRGSL